MSWTDKTLAEIFKGAAAAEPRQGARRGGLVQQRLTPAGVVDALHWPARIAAVNALVILGSLGIVTWAASVAAGYHVLRASRAGHDQRIWQPFCANFRKNLSVSMAVSGGLGLLLVIIAANLVFLHGRPEPTAIPLYIVNASIGLLWLWTAAAVVRQLDGGGVPSAVQLILSAARDATRPGARHLTIIVAIASAVALVIAAPLVGVLFSVGLMLHICSVFDRTPVSSGTLPAMNGDQVA